jgi:acetyl esterase/lipase
MLPLPAVAMLICSQVPLVAVPEEHDDPGANRAPAIAPQPLPAAALFDYDAALPLHFTVQGGQTQDNIRLVDGAFDGAPGSRVTCTYILPPNPSHAPAILFLHWGYTAREEFIPEAAALARRGIVCLLIDAPFARPEPVAYDPSIRGHDAALYIRTVVDCRRALDLLRSRPDTDPSRIAFIGHSFGGYIGGILSGVEPRFQSYVLIAAFPSLADTVRDQPSLAPQRDRLGPDRTNAYIAEMRPLDAAPFVAAARPLTLLMQFGSRDRDVTSDQAERLAAAGPSSTTVKAYLCGHEVNDPRALADRDEWLCDRFGISADR